MMSKVFVVILLSIYVTLSKATSEVAVIDETQYNFTGLATKYGLPCEEYDVITEDGYILKIFHIPGNKTKPVLLMHGMADSSDTLILRGNSSIVYSLSKAGYDVWLGNCRGNRYSRRHVFLNPDTDGTFWDFSMHEHGLYDLSVSIDFVLNKTEASRLNLIGYSEGTVIMFILGSLRPEYNDKINIFMAWTPICYLHNALNYRMPFTLIASQFWMGILARINMNEILQHGSALPFLANKFCSWYPEVCIFVLNNGFGFDAGGMEPEYLRIATAYYPAGMSKKTLLHFFQTLVQRRFAQYDYGPEKNLIKYNSTKSPLYDLRKVTVKVAMFTGKTDKFSTQEDVAILRRQLPNVVYYGVFENMNHISFSQSRHAYKQVFPTVFKLLKQYA